MTARTQVFPDSFSTVSLEIILGFTGLDSKSGPPSGADILVTGTAIL